MANLTKLFTQPVQTVYESITGAEEGTYTAELDGLVTKSRRIKGVAENKIWDYVQVENDPNFSRKQLAGKYDKLVSKLATSQKILTIIRGQLLLSRIQEFIPVNILNVLRNLTAINDTAQNLLSTYDSRLPLSLIERHFLQDLKIQFNNNVFSFQDLTSFAGIIADSLARKDDIDNNGLRGLLSLPIGSLLPNDLIGVFDTIQWLDELNNIFLEDEANQINNVLKNNTEEYKNKNISEIVKVDKYNNIKISYSDPYGINIREALFNEIRQDYSNFIKSQVEGVIPNNNETLIDILNDDFSKNLDELSESNVGLPSLFKVSEGITNVSNNVVVDAYTSAIKILIEEVFIQTGIVPNNDRPLDHLVNVKRNIERRIELRTVGASLDNYQQVDEFLKNNLINYKEEELDNTLKSIEEILNG